ncbi:NADPH:quinone reductase [Mycobacterium sp. 1274756.6]|uniref:NADPH:quinone reductase n=1 Tax=Mycobacterium sp. 1274756.6 TaxID=1834076 RepID=UPI0007FC3A6D|nr:NADPH:quinone reductase [Mycobacterium sp. 1274756.6]OBJ69681.1 oxidoreductase [Mycobacterium sp. 1274756.6]
MSSRAAYLTELGPADRIRFGPLPVAAPGPTDVVVRTEVLAINQVDTLVRSGAYRTPTPFPFVIGRDLVGTVLHTGSGVTAVRAGDPVWCNSMGHGGRQGSFAEQVLVPADRLYPLPAGVDPVDAVTVLHTAGTAWLGLFRTARIRPGDMVVIGGGAGGVGSAAVQLASAAGAHVIATAKPADHRWCRDSGAHTVIDYRDPELPDRLRAAAPDGIAVYWDTSGHQDLAAVAPLLRVGATVVITAASTSPIPLPARPFYTGDISVRGFAISNATVAELADAAHAINAGLTAGVLRGRAATRLPLSQAAEAHRLQERGQTGGGRIIVVP